MTGKELGTGRLDLNAHAVPITYQGRDGKQYVAVVVAPAPARPTTRLPRAPRRSPSLRDRERA